MDKKRVNILQVIKNLDGTDATTNTRTGEMCIACGQPVVKSIPFTLRDALIQCLVNKEIGPMGQPISPPGPVQFRRVHLALRIKDAKNTVRLSDNHITDFKELAPKFLRSVAMYRVYNILGIPYDGGDEEDGDEDDEKDGEENEQEDDTI